MEQHTAHTLWQLALDCINAGDHLLWNWGYGKSKRGTLLGSKTTYSNNKKKTIFSYFILRWKARAVVRIWRLSHATILSVPTKCCLVLFWKKRDVAFDEAAPNMFTYQHSPVYIYSKSAGGMRIYDIRGLIWTTSWNGLNGIVTNRGRWYRGSPRNSHQPSSPYHMCERVWQRQRIGDKQPWAPCAIYRHLSVYIYIYIHASRYDNNNNNTTSSSSNRTRNTLTHTWSPYLHIIDRINLWLFL